MVGRMMLYTGECFRCVRKVTGKWMRETETFLREFISVLVEPAAWEQEDEGDLRLVHWRMILYLLCRTFISSSSLLDVYVDAPALHVIVKNFHHIFWRQCYAPAIKLKRLTSKNPGLNFNETYSFSGKKAKRC
ncbi:hypothetical protein M758_1G315800 [Ceratodon purpureus]|nr:hypothetical protein M758_1G315800 [Ceratodon purpureus]